MPASLVEILLLFLLIFANGILAMAEMAVVSARKARLQQRAETGDERARTALELAKEPADFLSTVQVGITLVGTLAGAFGGVTVANRLAHLLAEIPSLAPYSHTIAVGLVVVLITYFSLVLGELAPKRLALSNSERYAAAIAAPMRALSKIAGPLVRLLSFSAGLVLRILGVHPSTEPPVTEEEVKILLELGTQAGVFLEVEQDMVERVFRLADRRVGSLMTPRTEILWLDLEDSAEVNRHKIITSVHSRLPVAIGDLDQVQGVVQAKKLLARCLAGKPLDLKTALHPPQIVPESTLALKVLEMFRQSRVHIALVIDEFGGIQGLVTIIDILEAIVGDIPTQEESGEPEAFQREDGSWLLDGMLPVDEFTDLFRLSNLPYEGKGYYQTLGGFVMSYIGRIPKSGDHFEWSGLRFEVLDMDGFRVDKVLVVPVEESSQPPSSG